MKKTQFLDARRNIRKEFVAFISIVMIGLLAALAYLGIVYSAATLKKDALSFFNRTGFWDVEVTSTMLMTDEDLDAIRALENVREAERVWQVEGDFPVMDREGDVTVISLPGNISKPILIEGRLPERADECAIEKKLADEDGYSVGQSITVSCDALMEVDPLAVHSFTVTGIVYSPDHFSYLVPVTPYLMVPENAFNLEGLNGAFMKARLRIDGAPEDRYGDDYNNFIDEVIADLETLADVRAPMRSDDLRSGFEDQIREGEEKIEAAREQLRESMEKLEDGRRELEAAEEQLGHMKELLDYTGYLLARTQRMIDTGTVDPEVAAQFPKYAWLTDHLNGSTLEMLFDLAEKELEKKRNDWYYSGEEYLDGLTRFEKGKKQLQEGEQQIRDGEQQIKEGEQQLADAKDKMNSVGTCRWVVFDNNTNPGFVYGIANSNKLASLSMSFSVIFLIVGALVIYATISRMVEQQRKLIGVNKALGLFNREIFAKYLFFACFAVLLGVGLGVGLAYLPMQRAVLSSYEAHLNYGAGTKSFLKTDTAIVLGGGLIVSFLAVYLGCVQLLRQSALSLIQGSSISSGRRKRGSSAKRSLFFRLILRNMMTDKNRVLVTIVSIAGGCVLMVVGFTIRYGISGIPVRQFGDIMTYDAEILFETVAGEETAETIKNRLDQTSLQYVPVRKESTVFAFNSKLNPITMIVAEKGSLEGFYHLRSILTSEPLELPDEGALVPRRFSEYYGINSGGAVTVFSSGMNRREVLVSDVFENYFGQIFFLTPRGYEKIFDTPSAPNCFFVKTGGMPLSEVQQWFADVPGILAVNDAAAGRTLIEQFNASLNFVVYLMLMIAAMMACFIVANFTVTFIQRKTPELTIMRINGFSIGECIRYLQLDLIVTTVLGTAIGLALGGLMGSRILHILETPDLQAIREPRLESFLFSALFTFVFSGVTNGFALRRIRKLKLNDIQ